MRRSLPPATLFVALLLGGACSDPSDVDAGPRLDDAGRTDAGARDAGDDTPLDGGSRDAGAADAGQSADGGAQAMSFFVTSVGNGAMAGNYGGLAGADARCTTLAAAAGAVRAQWRAYLSVQGPPVVHARDRIGAGPWFNAVGTQIAADLDALHTTGIDPADMFDETGAAPDSLPPGEMGTEHDILTGSTVEGLLMNNRTCLDWTSSSRDDRAQVGHYDWSDIAMPISPVQTWNSVHNNRCDEDSMRRNLGAARLYCFAID